MHLTEKHIITTYDVDCTNRVRTSVLFSFMQEAASNSANSLGWGFDDLRKEGLFWVLSRARLIINRDLPVGEELVLETWPKKIDGIFAIRDFRMFDTRQNTIGAATTCWLMINGSSMRPLKSSDLQKRLPYHDTDSAIEEVPGKIAEPDNKAMVYEKKMRYTDIDVNMHVNNVRHMESILDCFPADQYVKNRITSIQVNYLDQVQYGESLTLFLGSGGDDERVSYVEGLKNQEKKVFQALIEWAPKGQQQDIE